MISRPLIVGLNKILFRLIGRLSATNRDLINLVKIFLSIVPGNGMVRLKDPGSAGWTNVQILNRKYGVP